jgi:hypothetical protein
MILPKDFRFLSPNEPLQQGDWGYLKTQNKWIVHTDHSPRIPGATYARYTGPEELKGMVSPNTKGNP